MNWKLKGILWDNVAWPQIASWHLGFVRYHNTRSTMLVCLIPFNIPAQLVYHFYLWLKTGFKSPREHYIQIQVNQRTFHIRRENEGLKELLTQYKTVLKNLQAIYTFSRADNKIIDDLIKRLE